MNQTLLHSLRLSRDLIQLAVADLTAKDLLHVPKHKGNPAAFILGHLIWTERFIGGRLNIQGYTNIPDEAVAQFARGKTPREVRSYGDPLKIREQFFIHRNHTMAELEKIPPDTLAAPLAQATSGPLVLFTTLAEVANFIGIHSAVHAGQLTMIRRSLGKPPMF